MSKRLATEALFSGSGKKQDVSPAAERAGTFASALRGLNGQFAEWVAAQAALSGDALWSAGLRDYLRHADALLQEYADVLRDGGKQAAAGALTPPSSSNLFATPVPAGASGNGIINAEAGGSGASRKAVSFAPHPTFSGGAPAATPGPNTANAGHTPAPPSGLGFSFGATPAAAGARPGGGSSAPSPEPFRLGTTPPAAASGAGGGSSGSGFTFGGAGTAAGSSGGEGGTDAGGTGGGAAPPSSATRSAATTPSGFSFGGAAASTPAFGFGGAATPTATEAAVGGSSSNTAAITTAAGSLVGFGTTATAPAATTAATTTASASATTPAVSSSTPVFGFGMSATPTVTPAAGAGGASSSVPAFSFGAAATPAAATAGSTPAAAFGTTPPAASSSGGGGGGGVPAFSFGAPATAAAAGGTSATGGSLFNFPTPNAAPAALPDASGAGGDAGDEDAAPKFKPEIKVDESIWNVLFSAKARLHVRVKKDDGAHDWEPRGIGVLTVRQPKSGEGSDKAYVMFSTDVGKQLVSSPLMSSTAVMPFPQNPKKCRMSLMVLQYALPPAGAASSGSDAAAAAGTPKHMLQVCMISLGSADKVEELGKVVDAHKPK